MIGRSVRLLLCAVFGLLWASGWAAPYQEGLSLKGVWYMSLHEDHYDRFRLWRDLKKLKEQLKIASIVLPVPIFQADLTAINPTPDRDSPSFYGDFPIESAIDLAHQVELSVVLIPYLLIANGEWVGELAPLNVTEWFASWRAVLRHYANLAEHTATEVFLLGYELATMEPYHDEWERAINEVRQIYHGKISYITNWWPDRPTYEAVLAWTPWRLLDFIGISAYFELTDKNDPSPQELERAWGSDAHGQNILEDLAQLHARYDRCVLFAELGYESKDGANTEPWNFLRDAPPDPFEQRDAFQAALNVLSRQSWFGGYLVWAEKPGLPYTEEGYDLLAKPAAAIVRSHAMPSTSCPGARP